MLRIFKLFGVLLTAIVFSLATTAQAAPNWNTNVIQATGVGVPNPMYAAIPAQAMAMARTAAIADARRNLLAEVKGVQVDATTTVENHMTTSDLITQKISGLVVGARIVSEGEIPGGGYQVVMEMPMFGGPNSLAAAVIEPPTVPEPIPVPPPTYNPPVVETPSYTPSISGGYTGLIVDCRGLGNLRPVMSPVVMDANMKTFYGHKYLSVEQVIRDGMASYARDMSEATRAGSNPLVVRAIAIDDLQADPIVSMEDTELILYENNKSHFLENTAVVFLY